MIETITTRAKAYAYRDMLEAAGVDYIERYSSITAGSLDWQWTFECHDEFWERCRNLDWDYPYHSDQNAWRAGSEEHRRLVQAAFNDDRKRRILEAHEDFQKLPTSLIHRVQHTEVQK